MPYKSKAKKYVRAAVATAVAAKYKRYTNGPKKSTPYHGRKPATKSRGGATTVTRRKPKFATPGGGYVRPTIAYSHGRHQRLSKAFITKARQAVSAIDTQQYQNWTSSETSAVGTCNYLVNVALYDPTHILTMNSHAGSYPDAKFTIRNATMTMQIANARNTPCYIRVYEVQARADVPANATYTNFLAYLTKGWVDGGQATMSTNIDGNVFSSPTFCTWFKVLKVNLLEFQPGETRRIMLQDKSPTLINMERWAPGGTNYTIAHARKTKFLIFQHWGSTINDSVTKTNISTDISKIDVVTTTKYEFQYVQDINPTIYLSGGFATVNTPEFISEETGAVTTGVSA